MIPDKNRVLFERTDKNGRTYEVLFKELNTNIEFILGNISNVFEVALANLKAKNETNKSTIKYIIRKLVKISLTYSQYEDFFNPTTRKFNEDLFEGYLRLLRDNPSHVTYKLKQAIHYIKYPRLINKSEYFKLNIERFSQTLSNFLSQNPGLEIIELIPPAIFASKIILIDDEKRKSDFELLSSGEKQLTHSVSSVLYNIKNIDSVDRSNDELISYSNINIILDEIELYYHPEMQRQYLNYLVKMIARLELFNTEAINICLITHSPYILSDMPHYFILKLDNGRPVVENGFGTFGANIHDLLKNDFFLFNGSMGKFAKATIEDAINFINHKKLASEISVLTKKNSQEDKILLTLKEKEEMELRKKVRETNESKHKEVISIIGEPILQIKLAEMFDEITNDNLELRVIRQRIKDLQESEKKLIKS